MDKKKKDLCPLRTNLIINNVEHLKLLICMEITNYHIKKNIMECIYFNVFVSKNFA